MRCKYHCKQRDSNGSCRGGGRGGGGSGSIYRSGKFDDMVCKR